MEADTRPRKQDLIKALTIGVAGAAVFLFAFPGRAIPTLMHEVLKLPGPGIGFGFILGPYIIALSLIAYRYTGKYGSSVAASTIFAFTISLLVSALKLQTPAPGKLESIEFITAVIILGMSTEAGLYLFRRRRRFIRYTVSALISNTVFVLYSLQVIFAQTLPEKYAALTLNKTLIILSVSAVGAVLSALLANAIPEVLKKRR